jgi:hemerythrin superfamily protein
MPSDAIVILKNDHKEMRKLFRDFQRAKSQRQQGEVAERILEELTVHTYIENECMYPVSRELVPDVEDDILEAFEEHHVADVLAYELSMMRTEDERFEAKMTVLIENVTHHMEEEEQELFPLVREKLGRKKLVELGERLTELRDGAPRTPTAPKALKKALDAAGV